MTITIIIDRMSMHCCINMQNTKLLYQFEWNNLNYLSYEGGCFNNNECGFKVTILVGM